MPILSAIQYKPKRLARCPADVSDNFRLCEPLVLHAGKMGVQMMVFPELSFTGYSFLSWDDAVRVSEPKDGPTFECMSRIAKDLKCYVVWGFVEIDGEVLYNSSSIANPEGDLILTNRKLNLWGNDFLWAVPGEDLPGVVETELGWMSTIICRDVIDRSPRSLGSGLFYKRKVDIVAVPMNWSGGGFPSTEWMEFSQNNSCTVIAANRWGKEENRSFSHDFGQGGSAIIGKDGKPHIGGLIFGRDSVVVAMVDL